MSDFLDMHIELQLNQQKMEKSATETHLQCSTDRTFIDSSLFIDNDSASVRPKKKVQFSLHFPDEASGLYSIESNEDSSLLDNKDLYSKVRRPVAQKQQDARYLRRGSDSSLSDISQDSYDSESDISIVFDDHYTGHQLSAF
jgi:hypothetical protein